MSARPLGGHLVLILIHLQIDGALGRALCHSKRDEI